MKFSKISLPKEFLVCQIKPHIKTCSLRRWRHHKLRRRSGLPFNLDFLNPTPLLYKRQQNRKFARADE